MVRLMRHRDDSNGVAVIAKYAVAVVLIAALSALQDSYQYGNGNQVFQLPKVHQLMEPELYPEDALVHSLRNYPSAIYPAIAWTASTLGIDIEPLYFALWVIVRLSLVALIMLISARFVNDFRGQVFVTLAACTTQWAIRRTIIGGEHIMSEHLTHTELAFTLQLAALAAWLYRRPVLAGALIGAAVHVNAMTTVHAGGFLLLLWALSEDRFNMRYLWALLTSMAIAAPYGLELHAAMSGTAGAAAETERFWELLRMRRGPHYFLDAAKIAALASIALTMLLIGSRRETPDALRQMMVAGVIYVAAMYVVALAGVHLSSSKLVILFHPLRGDKMLHLVLVIAVPTFIWLQGKRRSSDCPGRVLLAPIAAAFMLGYTPPAVALAVLPALLGLFALSAERQTIAGINPREVLLGGVLIVSVGLLALPYTTFYATTLILSVIAGRLMITRLHPEPLLLGFVALIALGLMSRNLGLPDERPQWYRAGEDRSFVEVAEWAARETPPAARFITPTWMEGWRCLSLRGTLVQYRDLSAMHWDVGFEEGFFERLRALDSEIYYGPDLARLLREAYLNLRPGVLAAAAERFSVDYVVMPAEWRHGQGPEPVFANEGYRVLPVGALREGTGTDENAHEMEASEDGQ